MLLNSVETKLQELRALSVPQQQRQSTRRGRGNRQLQEEEQTPQAQFSPMVIAYQNAWDVLIKYNNLTDQNHEIYAAATLLNPCLRKRFFEVAWTDDAAGSIQTMLQTNRGVWEDNYRQNTPTPPPEVPRSALSIFMYDLCVSNTQQPRDDEFERYITASITPFTEWKEKDLFQWWMNCEYTQLRQWAFDTLSIPAMSAELERVFSQSRRFFTDDRNRLSAEQFEAVQCLKQWSLQEVYTVLPTLDEFGTPE